MRVNQPPRIKHLCVSKKGFLDRVKVERPTLNPRARVPAKMTWVFVLASWQGGCDQASSAPASTTPTAWQTIGRDKVTFPLLSNFCPSKDKVLKNSVVYTFIYLFIVKSLCVCECFATCMHLHYVHAVPQSLEEGINLPELELRAVASCHGGTGNQTWVPWKNKHSQAMPSLQSPLIQHLKKIIHIKNRAWWGLLLSGLEFPGSQPSPTSKP